MIPSCANSVGGLTSASTYKDNISINIREVKNGFLIEAWGIGYELQGNHVAKDKAEVLSIVTGFLK